MPFDVQSAKQAGYSDAEIAAFLAEDNSKFDISGAKEAGYSDEEIAEHLSQDKSHKEPELRQGKPSFIETATSNVSPLNDPSKMATISDQAIASLPSDIKERASYFAKQRFPDDANGVARYGVQDGRLFYTGDDGKMYYEEPKLSLSPEEMGKYAASAVGPGLPFVGGIVGGVATSSAAGIPGAGLGAAAGDEARQLLAMHLAGQENFSPLQSVKEAGVSAIGQGIGVGAGKGINYVRGTPKDAFLLNDPKRQADMSNLQTWAKEWGIDLTPAEITNLKSMKAQQNVLGDLPASSDIMQDFYVKRNTEQVPRAIDKSLDNLSTVKSAEIGAQNLQSGAKDTIAAQMAERQRAAAPFYEKSRNVVVDTSKYQELMKDPFLKKQIKSVMSNPKYQSDIGDLFPQSGSMDASKILDASGNPVTNKIPPIDAKVGFLDVVKKRIDGLIESAKTSGNKNDVRIYKNAKEKLVSILDEASPDYKTARGIFEHESPPITELTKGEVGAVAKKSPTQLEGITKTLFETGPDIVAKNRIAYVKAGKEQEWNDGLRSYLTEAFDKSSKEYLSGNANPGAKFRSIVMGTPKQKAVMKNAMSPTQWVGFNRLMDVLEATGRVPQGGSRTAFSQQAIQDMKRQSGGAFVPTVLNPVNALGRMQNAYQEMMMGRHADKLARIITSPDAMAKVKNLKGLNPKSLRAVGVVTQILEDAGIGTLQNEGKVSPGAL